MKLKNKKGWPLIYAIVSVTTFGYLSSVIIFFGVKVLLQTANGKNYLNSNLNQDLIYSMKIAIIPTIVVVLMILFFGRAKKS